MFTVVQGVSGEAPVLTRRQEFEKRVVEFARDHNVSCCWGLMYLVDRMADLLESVRAEALDEAARLAYRKDQYVLADAILSLKANDGPSQEPR